jgi:predicted Zn finger-like uncharacterized protein
MPITLLCPRLVCRAVLRVPDAVRGKRVRCPECGSTFLVPEQKPNAPPPKSPAQTPSAPKGKS